MGRTVSREMEWGIGLSFVVGMVILLVLAIAQFEGPVTVILLVTSGVFLLVGTFFLTGTQDARPSPDGHAPQRTQPPEGGTAAAAPSAAQDSVLACPSCGAPNRQGERRCAECGAELAPPRA